MSGTLCDIMESLFICLMLDLYSFCVGILGYISNILYSCSSFLGTFFQDFLIFFKIFEGIFSLGAQLGSRLLWGSVLEAKNFKKVVHFGNQNQPKLMKKSIKKWSCVWLLFVSIFLRFLRENRRNMIGKSLQKWWKKRVEEKRWTREKPIKTLGFWRFSEVPLIPNSQTKH